MANRPKGYGYSREVADKIKGKYSDDDELEIKAWILSVTNLECPGEGQETFHEWLRDGSVLCTLMNCLVEGSCKINNCDSHIPAMRKNKEMENISFFLKAAKAYGVKPADLFQTVDLYEAQNLSQVQTTIYKLSAVASKNGFQTQEQGIGAKIAEKNKRAFDEQQLREGRNIIGLQMGTNQVASQEGMTPYGLGRQLTPQTK